MWSLRDSLTLSGRVSECGGRGGGRWAGVGRRRGVRAYARARARGTAAAAPAPAPCRACAGGGRGRAAGCGLAGAGGVGGGDWRLPVVSGEPMRQRLASRLSSLQSSLHLDKYFLGALLWGATKKNKNTKNTNKKSILYFYFFPSFFYYGLYSFSWYPSTPRATQRVHAALLYTCMASQASQDKKAVTVTTRRMRTHRLARRIPPPFLTLPSPLPPPPLPVDPSAHLPLWITTLLAPIPPAASPPRPTTSSPPHARSTAP